MTPSQSPYIPERGDIVDMNFSPQYGHEQDGWRPALILSPFLFNKSGFALMCPITNTNRPYPRWQVEMPQGFTITGVVMIQQVKSLDWFSRTIYYSCKCPEAQLNEALAKVRALIS